MEMDVTEQIAWVICLSANDAIGVKLTNCEFIYFDYSKVQPESSTN